MFYSLAIQLDETTTVSDESVLIAYFQYIDGDDLKQDILMSTSLATTTTGQDIFAAVDSYLSSNSLSYKNLSHAALMVLQPGWAKTRNLTID